MRNNLDLYYWYSIRDRFGNLKRSRKRVARSFLTAFITGLYLRAVSGSTINRTDTGGTSRALQKTTLFNVDTPSGTSTEGLVVGTGTTAPTITDSKLQTQIAHGVGSGQLQYAASVVNVPTSDATSTSVILTRDFTNGSGGTITIQEIGIYAEMNYGAAGNSLSQFCIVRDLATISLTNGALLTLNYELKTTA